jgi:hypothetical protein
MPRRNLCSFNIYIFKSALKLFGTGFVLVRPPGKGRQRLIQTLGDCESRNEKSERFLAYRTFDRRRDHRNYRRDRYPEPACGTPIG